MYYMNKKNFGNIKFIRVYCNCNRTHNFINILLEIEDDDIL